MTSKLSLLTRLRIWIGSMGFKIFLWAHRITQEEYFKQIGAGTGPAPFEEQLLYAFKDFNQTMDILIGHAGETVENLTQAVQALVTMSTKE